MKERFKDYLGSNEETLWTGRPQQGLLFRSYDLFWIPSSLIFASFAGLILMELFLGAAQNAQEWRQEFTWSWIPFLAIPFLFVIIGFYMAFGRFFTDMVRRANTYYAISNERALIVSGFFGQNLDAIGLEPQLLISMRGKSRGSIHFGAEPKGTNPIVLFMMPSDNDAFTFEKIKDVRKVYALIIEIQQKR